MTWEEAQEEEAYYRMVESILSSHKDGLCPSERRSRIPSGAREER
jgi:hypothetical protein